MFSDIIIVVGRIITILPLLLVIALFMGKRSIGELPVFDLLVILVLGSVVGADIADPKINHIHTIVAMIVIALLQKTISYYKLKSRRLGSLLTFEPTIIIYRGQFLRKNLKKVYYAIEDVLPMLREKNIFQIKDVEIAIIEPNGSLSVRCFPEKEPVKAEDLHIKKKGDQLDIPIILDGEIQSESLSKINKNKEWIRKKLNALNIPDETRVFYGALDSEGEFYVSLKEKKQEDKPPPILY